MLADRDIMPDPEFYHDCLVAAYEELYAAAIKLGPGKPKSAAIAAKARIHSPKRARAVTRGKGQATPKLLAKTASYVESCDEIQARDCSESNSSSQDQDCAKKDRERQGEKAHTG